MLEEQASACKKASYNLKPDTAFGNHIRTVRLVGKDQGVVDHRTGVTHTNPMAYLRGDIGRFLVPTWKK